MRIAIIIPGTLPVPPQKGGAVENLIYTIIKENEISNNHINIDLYGIEDEFEDEYNTNQNNTRYILSKVNNYYGKNIFIKIVNKLKKNNFIDQTLEKLNKVKYDYIIVENRPNYIRKIKQYNDSKIILHMHNEHLTGKKDYSKEIKLCYKVIVVSNYIKNTIISRYNVEEDKIIVLHNGIDTDKFNVIKDDRIKQNLRFQYGISENDFVVLFSGRLTKEKGILELINAFKKCSKKENIKLLIVGANWFSSKSKDEFINTIEEQSKSIINNVIFTGYVDYNQVNKVYSIADIAVLPSIWNDPFPLTVLECMSVGLPVISTISGGIPEMIDEECGILLPVDEKIENNIYNHIIKFYNKEYDIEKMSKKARKNIENKYNKNKFYDNFINILKEI